MTNTKPGQVGNRRRLLTASELLQLEVIRDTYRFLHEEAASARAELLEVAIVLLIVMNWDKVKAFLAATWDWMKSTASAFMVRRAAVSPSAMASCIVSILSREHSLKRSGRWAATSPARPRRWRSRRGPRRRTDGYFAATVADRHYVVEHGTVIDMIEIGAGGGSIASLDRGGMLQVGGPPGSLMTPLRSLSARPPAVRRPWAARS